MPDPFDKILIDAADAVAKGAYGVAVLCHSAETADKLKRLLYVHRAKAQKIGINDYDDLSISFSPHAGDILYIYRKEQEDGEENRQAAQEDDAPTV